MADTTTTFRRRIVVPEIRSPEAARPLLGRDRLVHVRGETMGTTWSVRLYASSAACASQVRQAVQAALDHVVAEMSPWVAQSALSQFNAAPANTWHVLPTNFFAVLTTALSIARDSDGAFDPTVGALVNAWGFGPARNDRDRVLPEQEAQRTAETCGWSRLEVDDLRRAVRQNGGIHLDLCGIAKGFGVDQTARVLRRLGIRDFLIDVGGELGGEGVKPDGTPWWVAFEQPPSIMLQDTRASDVVIALHGLSVATSGDYRRFFDHGGRRYGHTIDPRSGYPAANGVTAVTVLHESCMHADALATAMMVLGPVDGLAFAERRGVAARMSLRNGNQFEELISPALSELLSESDEA